MTRTPITRIENSTDVWRPVGRSPIEPIGDSSIVGPREAILGERGTRSVATQSLERRTIGGCDRDRGERLVGPWAAPTFLEGKTARPDGNACAYVCTATACSPPTSKPEQLVSVLD